MPLILGANSVSGGYEVDNSLRFNSGSSDSLTRSLGGSPTSKRIATWSFWVKRSNLGSGVIYSNEVEDDNNRGYIQFNSDQLRMVDEGSPTELKASQVFRDVSAWYHILVACDTTQATSTNRVKFYVNGNQISIDATTTFPSQNTDLEILTGGQTNKQHIGKIHPSSTFFNGYFSEFYFIDGQQLDPTDFGEFDADTNIWKPIPYTGSFGTNGFYLQFKNSAALGTDSSGNGNTFTANNLTSVDQSTDTCTNNFATMNPLMAYPSTNITISDGNLDVIRTAGTSWQNILSSFAPSVGKWYAEIKVTGVGSNGVNIGFANINVSNIQNLTSAFGEDANSAGIYSASGAIFYNSGTTFATVGSYTAGDIIQLAMDIDNGFLYWGKNGTWLNSADPESGGVGTGGLALSNLTSGGSYAMGVSLRNSGDVTWNFGNPAFTISSGNADANGYGNFEYAVPSGYFALCTKNLAEYG